MIYIHSELMQNICFESIVSYIRFPYLNFEHAGQEEIGSLNSWLASECAKASISQFDLLYHVGT